MFANGPRDQGSIPSWVTPKTQKCYLMPPCLILRIIRYSSRVKWSNPEKDVASSLTLCCCSYRKGIPQVTLDYGHQLYFYFTYSFTVKNGSISNNSVYHTKTVLFQTIQFSIFTYFKCQNSSISNNTIQHKYAV